MKTFKKAPLPFLGQKRNFVKRFSEIVDNYIEGGGEGWTIVDVFGGSGLLAHVAKRLKPQARVIYNDFDNYCERLAHIEDINRLKNLILAILSQSQSEYGRCGKLDKKTSDLIFETIKNFKGYIDIQCLQTWLLFSASQISNLDKFFKKDLYNRLPKNDYPAAEDYLNGLEVVSKTFDELIPEFSNQKNTLLILDPPYIFTNQDLYKNSKYFSLLDFFKLMELIKPPFVLFSSCKTETLEYLNFDIACGRDKFKDYKSVEINSVVGNGKVYKDHMIYKL